MVNSPLITLQILDKINSFKQKYLLKNKLFIIFAANKNIKTP